MQKNPNMKWYILIGIGLIMLIILILVLAALLANKTTDTSLKQCTYDGGSYVSGSSFLSSDGCNTCSCTNGSVACTVMACLPTSTPAPTSSTATPTVLTTVSTTLSTTPSTTPISGGLKIYFGKPSSESDYTTLGYVERATDAVGLGQVTVILNSLLAGPTAAEKALGYTGVLSVSGPSTCADKTYQYFLTGAGTTLNVKFCKTLNYIANTGTGGAYAGMGMAANGRVILSLTQSLKINGITTVIIRQSDNSCFAPDTGLNASCT